MTEARGGALVSVLIPCYNAERWIGATLESVRSQTWKSIEVVVVNDGSTDGSRRVIENFAYPGLKLVNQENRGQTAALNRCLQEARGDYVQFLDADDLLDPEKIEKQLRCLQEQPACVATANWARFTDDPGQAVFATHRLSQNLAPLDWLVGNWETGGGMMFPGMWLVPMAIVRAVGPWREELTLSNDTEYFSRVVLASRRVLFCEGARVYYRSAIAGSLSALKSAAGWQSQFRVINLCERHLLGAEDSDRTRRACSMLWQRLAHSSYPYVADLANDALARAARMHADTLAPEGGPWFRLVAKLLGWKRARVLQRMTGRY